MHRTRNAAYGQPYRGFESLPLRHPAPIPKLWVATHFKPEGRGIYPEAPWSVGRPRRMWRLAEPSPRPMRGGRCRNWEANCDVSSQANALRVLAFVCDRRCRGISKQASDPGERGDADLAFSQCVKGEQAMRQKLMGEWSTFAPADKATCVGSERGGLPSYTDLVTCLEMARDARQMNK
jgi:hypothetical protein